MLAGVGSALRRAATAAWLLACGACRCEAEGAVQPTAPSSIHALAPLPDGGLAASHAPGRRCPADMVDVGGELCIDRHESQLVDVFSGRELSPFYHPTRERTRQSYAYWTSSERTTHAAPWLSAAQLLVPAPPAWQLTSDFRPRAVNRAGALPQGYMSGLLAREVCRNAGKRLCREHEWVRACRGERDRRFPYGDSYERGACNVGRQNHPAALLHGKASMVHRDPRLNRLADADGPLLRASGASSRCRSPWGDDAVFDMVGNLDEWVDDPHGAFLGGFYARQTRAGCAARVSAHPNPYFDYSLGVRCCR